MSKIKLNSSVIGYNPKSALKTALTCAISTIAFSSFSNEIVKDSVGIKKEAGKTFVLYKVEPKQTLFSIVKRYGSSVAEFKAANPGISESVNVGQTIKIPYKGNVVASTPKYVPPSSTPTPTPTPPPEAVKMVSHVVESGQGLYAVATKHKVTMADLRKWNNLTTDVLTSGQVLIVDAREYERAKKAGELPAKGEVVKVEDTNLGNNSTTTTTTQKPVSEPVDVNETKTSSETSKTSSGYRKTVETGLAELIDVEDKSGKYLGLHRSAPAGTLVNVKNSSNGQSIWVKIVGKLPDIGSDKVIIKLSPRAFEKLNPSDKRIRAEISYMTP